VSGALRVVESQEPVGYGRDDFGFDPAFTMRMKPLFEWIYRRYFRVEIDGVENVPTTGRALLTANHSGVVPWDGAMIRTAIMVEHQQPRHARMLVADFAFATPVLSDFLLRTGNVLAHPDNAQTLLERDELVGVFPEGIKGAAKRFSQRYQVQRFGRGGFVQVALRTGAPILPVAVVGGEEIHPVIYDFPALGRALGTGTVPLTLTFPWLGLLGLLPLPSKWFISFGKPIETSSLGPEAADDQALVLEIGDEVRGWIQARLDQLRGRRSTPFF
jgi:1-acyl-sn-glycerol-3-phosphate acyltransferase